MDLARWLVDGVQRIGSWEASYGENPAHPALQVTDEQFGEAFEHLCGRLADNYPFFHPRFAGQMLKPPHPAAVAAYTATMLINPNNHALDGGPATAEMEKEVVAQLADMFRLPAHLGHLTSSGTIANLEALYVAREIHPDRAVAFSVESHYTHARMCGVLGVAGVPVEVDGSGRMNLDALAELLNRGEIGTVVATAGTTGLGAIDPIHEIVRLCRDNGVRVHVDAAYGGFFTLLAQEGSAAPIDARPWNAIAHCDSVVVDPHKHGLQPYGCGAVLFADPEVGRFFVHDSPYTYFTSESLHLGEISLECSRAGAAAAALWLTLRLIPLTPQGLGAGLAAGRRAALSWAGLIEESSVLDLYQRPELDIVTYYPAVEPPRLSEIDAASAAMLSAGMTDPLDPVFLSVLRVDHPAFTRRRRDLRPDAEGGRILRSVLMKPESESYLPALHSRVEDLARSALLSE